MSNRYDNVENKLNDYATDKLFAILEKFSCYIDTDSERKFGESTFNKFDYVAKFSSQDKIISVDQISESISEHFNNNVPVGHGTRTLNDFKIHLYPEAIKSNNDNEDEIVHYFKTRDIITHEIFHLFFTLDINDDYENKELVDFGHFITEGMVQSETENFEGKIDLSSNYRKNVELANMLKSMLPKKEAYQIIINKNILEIMNEHPHTKVVFDEYLKIKDFIKDIEPIASYFSEILGDKDLINSLKRYTVEQSIQLIDSTIDEYGDESIRETFNEIKAKYNFEKKEVSL